MSLTKVRKPEFVVILPYVKNKILMQLRDEKENINFPGQWGFFGGTIDIDEIPEVAARRELLEEIGYKPRDIHKFFMNKIPEHGNCIAHAYCCPLTINAENIKLKEGTDFGLFSIEEVRTGYLYSTRMKKSFSTIRIPHLMSTINAFLEYLKNIENIKNL